jgi:AcrR family transcriptional regulator
MAKRADAARQRRDRRTAEGRAADARSQAGARVAGRAARRRSGADTDSRGLLLQAAAAEFAAHGYAGSSVDRIAAAAGLNKAMIYYHFKSKAALYREIVGDMFRAVGVRIREVAASDASPEDKVRGFVAAIALEAEARPHFPAIWFREIAEEGTHLDDATLAEIAGIVQALVGILRAGVRAGRFKPVSPMLVHGGIVAPIMLYFGSLGLRTRLERAGLGRAAFVSREAMVAHVQGVALAVLKGTM